MSKKGLLSKLRASMTGNTEAISAKVRPYQFAAKIATALTENFNDFVVVLMEGFKQDFSIDRSAFFLIDQDNVWRLKAKIGNDLPDYDLPPPEDEKIQVRLIKGNLVSQPKEGVGFDLYIIIRDENRKAIGILAMDDTSKSREFNSDEIEAFTSLADTLNILLKQKNIYDDLTVRDPLTGLFNRNILKDVEKDFANVDCIWQLDIDHFKKINDTYGHPAGDAVLRHLAKYLRDKLRKDDVTIIRHGGEEFIVVMKRINPVKGLDRVKELSKQFKAEKIQLPSGKLLCDVTFSVGFHTPKKRETFEESMTAVDKLLYIAKDRGRNKVVSII